MSFWLSRACRASGVQIERISEAVSSGVQRRLFQLDNSPCSRSYGRMVGDEMQVGPARRNELRQPVAHSPGNRSSRRT